MKLPLLSFYIALSLSTINLSIAEEMRSAAPASGTQSSTVDDCDDTDRACSPVGDLDGDGTTDSAAQGPTGSSTTGGATALDALDNDCDGDSCAPSSSSNNIKSPVCMGKDCPSSSSKPASGNVDQDCGGAACDSPRDKQPPSSMAPSKQGMHAPQGNMHLRCEGSNCPAADNSPQPSGMAINEKGLPSKKKPADTKDKTK